MKLSRKQFDILSVLTSYTTSLTQRELSFLTNNSLGSTNAALKDLIELGLIHDGKISQKGILALEPYRVKRAIFLAAGFGSRLVPITFNTPKPLIRVKGIRIIDRLIESCLKAGINEIYIVRGYLGELFDQLLYKYPMIKFLENPIFNESNNISSSFVARYLLANSYVFESDLLINNPSVIKKYHYSSNYYGVKKIRSDDWVLKVKKGIIYDETIGAEGDNIYQMLGISYWNEEDGNKLIQDIFDVYNSPGGKERYWEQVPLVYKKEHYEVEIYECQEGDIIEIDTFNELKQIDKTYDV